MAQQPDPLLDVSDKNERKDKKNSPINIATISAGFEKGDFLVREGKGQRVFFDFFEEAFNYISNKGYSRMTKEDEEEWLSLVTKIHTSIKGGMRYNTGKLLMVLSKPANISSGKMKSSESGSVKSSTVPILSEEKRNAMETLDNFQQYTGEGML